MAYLVFLGSIGACLLYALAALSGWRLLRMTRGYGFFHWGDMRHAGFAWIAHLWDPSYPLPSSFKEAHWSVVWLAAFLSTCAAVVMFFAHARVLFTFDFESATIARAFWVPGHLFAAFGTVGFHIGAALIFKKFSEGCREAGT
ncbi:MAG: hypothetical protein CMB99_16570 [Flavobacteriaceae bacterium]|jgi:hypothetical protein|nr:hypothetical protein [Flavobacteriaceae bacterium]|tara:strand:- start:9489 stop:9917 length:429 start_codon:yes stop_codon:yes gene_type:complete